LQRIKPMVTLCGEAARLLVQNDVFKHDDARA